MTREEAIRCLSIHSSTNGSGLCTDKQHYEAKQMAIKVLMQEPCDDAISRVEALKIAVTEYELKKIRELPSVNPQPCDDAISREAVQEAFAEYVASGFAESVADFEGYTDIIMTLPSVTQKSGKWILQPSNKEQGERDFIWWKCSECGQVIYSETERDRREYHAFCGRCGAKMESEE